MSSELLERHDGPPNSATLYLDEEAAVGTVDFGLNPQEENILRLGRFLFHFDAKDVGALTKIEYPFDPNQAMAEPMLPVEDFVDSRLGREDMYGHTILRLFGVGLWDELQSASVLNTQHHIDGRFTVTGQKQAIAARIEVHRAIQQAQKTVVTPGVLAAELRGDIKSPKLHKLRKSLGVRLATLGLAAATMFYPAFDHYRDAAQTGEEITTLEKENDNRAFQRDQAQLIMDDIENGVTFSGGEETPSLPTDSALSALASLEQTPEVAASMTAIASEETALTVDDLSHGVKFGVRSSLQIPLQQLRADYSTTATRINDLSYQEIELYQSSMNRGTLALLVGIFFAYSQFRGPSRLVRTRAKGTSRGLKW